MKNQVTEVKNHMQNELPDYDMVRFLSIFSTATGYDILSYRVSTSFGFTKRKVYRNISSHSIRRFYRLSENDIDFQKDAKIGWQRHQRLFPNPL
jgi:hypothetical protein